VGGRTDLREFIMKKHGMKKGHGETSDNHIPAANEGVSANRGAAPAVPQRRLKEFTRETPKPAAAAPAHGMVKSSYDGGDHTDNGHQCGHGCKSCY
jgi:hypothetical protein